MIYVLKLKGRDMYLHPDGFYRPDMGEAECFFDYADVKSCADENEEIIGIENDSVQVIK
ncbi:hypothetical protein ACDZ28_13535 [Paenibacillus sp. RS8]|uniref:hypothetical protein n=1 Tax=Paenibacillus sp. RS8 TaxID=3242681 RepID=UPI0035C10B99